MRKTTLQKACELYETEIRWMTEHGWTEEEYVKRYGSTDMPKLGDGGSLIWEADFASYMHARNDFLAQYSRYLRSSKKEPELVQDQARKLLFFDGVPKEIEAIISYKAFAKGLVQSFITGART